MKYYVVWNGLEPGIYDNWEDCQAMVINFPGAKYRSYPTLEAATEAFRKEDSSNYEILKSIGNHLKNSEVNYSVFPEIRLDAIAVDGACAHNPGPMEYRGVIVGSGKEIFHIGPLEGGTNNIAEYLALVHALALLKQKGDLSRPIYTDSRTALAWLRNRHSRTTIVPSKKNQTIRELLRRADIWMENNPGLTNPVLKWNTEEWGEIPADFGRK